MGRFYQTTEQEFLDPDKMVYNPNYDLALKMIMHKEQQYKELEAVADSIFNVQFNHLNSEEDKETARIQKQYFQEKADELARQLQADPNNLGNIQTKLKSLQRELTENKTRGQIANLENSYNAFHNWNKENSKLCEENPALCQAMKNEAMRNWGGDSLKRTWSQEQLTKGIDWKTIEQNIQKLEADIWNTAKEAPGGRYIVKIGNEEKILSREDIRNYAINSVMSNPEYVHHMKQSDRVGISKYLNPDGTINLSGELTQKLQALDSYAYRQHKDLYEVREDKFALENLKFENEKKLAKYKKDLEEGNEFIGSQARSEKIFDGQNYEEILNYWLSIPPEDLHKYPQIKTNLDNIYKEKVDSLYATLNFGDPKTKQILTNLGINTDELSRIENKKRQNSGQLTTEEWDIIVKAKDAVRKRMEYEDRVEKEYKLFMPDYQNEEEIEKVYNILARKYPHLIGENLNLRLKTDSVSVKRDENNNIVDVIHNNSYNYNSIYGSESSIFGDIKTKKDDFDNNFKLYITSEEKLKNFTQDTYYHALNPINKDGKMNNDYKFLQEISDVLTLKNNYTTYNESGNLREDKLDVEVEDMWFWDKNTENFNQIMKATGITNLAEAAKDGRISVRRADGSDGKSETLYITFNNEDESVKGNLDTNQKEFKIHIPNYNNNYQELRNKYIKSFMEANPNKKVEYFSQLPEGQKLTTLVSSGLGHIYENLFTEKTYTSRDSNVIPPGNKVVFKTIESNGQKIPVFEIFKENGEKVYPQNSLGEAIKNETDTVFRLGMLFNLVN